MEYKLNIYIGNDQPGGQVDRVLPNDLRRMQKKLRRTHGQRVQASH
jgi:hypothetical protein